VSFSTWSLFCSRDKFVLRSKRSSTVLLLESCVTFVNEIAFQRVEYLRFDFRCGID
jgi:hypothetical protein